MKTSRQTRKSRLPLRRVWVLATAATLLACPGAQVRPPKPQPCPPGAPEALKELGILLAAEQVVAHVPGGDGGIARTRIRKGEVSYRLVHDMGLLPAGTLLQGQTYFGETRVYSRLTKAQTPDWRTFPICMVMVDRDDGRPGTPMQAGSETDSAIIFSEVKARVVGSFD